MCAAARDRQEPHGIAAPPRQKAFDMFVTDKEVLLMIWSLLGRYLYTAFQLPLVHQSPRVNAAACS
jgi:hypothetical protein